PVAPEVDPRILRSHGLGVAGDDVHHGGDLAPGAVGVVTADALGGAAAEVERGLEVVRVRALGRIHDWVGALDPLQLGVAPFGALGPVVLAVAHLGGRGVQGG